MPDKNGAGTAAPAAVPAAGFTPMQHFQRLFLSSPIEIQVLM